MGRAVHPHIITDDSALGGSVIERSLRFNDDDSTYLNRTPSSSSNRKTFTISWWFKIGNLGTGSSSSARAFFGAYDNSTSGNDGYYFSSSLGSDNKLYFGAWSQNWRGTNRVFRDVNAWYHCVVSVDTTQSTAADRVKIYINGVEETSFSVSNNPSQYYDLGWNFSSQMHTIGRVNYLTGSGPYSFDGYIAEFNSVDGQQLDPTHFGYTESQTGLWRPKKFIPTGPNNGTTWSSTTQFDANVFDGDYTDFFLAQVSNGYYTATTSPFTIKQSLGVITGDGYNWGARFNGSTEVTTGNLSNLMGFNPQIRIVNFDLSGVTLPFDVTNLQLKAGTGSSGSTNLYGIVVDGVVLIDGDISNIGLNGFHLEFKDNSSTSALGKDTSNNRNDFTTNNFSVSAGDGNDSLEDTPTNNFATFNPLIYSANTFSDGNLKVTCTSSTPAAFHSTLGVSSGKYYMEFLVKSVSNYPIGVSGYTNHPNYYSGGDEIGFWLDGSVTRVFRNGSNITGNSVVVGNFETGVEGSSTGWSVDDIAGLALDMDEERIYLYKGSTQVGYVDFSGFNYEKVFFGGGNYISGNVYIGNFGQRPFSYTPPSGYKTLNSKNLPPNVPSIIRSQKHFESLIYTGDGTATRSISGLEFKPDLVWIKNRSQTDWHIWGDSVRGFPQTIYSNRTEAEVNGAGSGENGHIASAHDHGFVVKDDDGSVGGNCNANSENYVAWCWKAGGTAVSNSDGSITSSISANTEAGFSIVTWTGNGSDGATVGHGLGTKPDWIIIKKRANNSGGNTGNWITQHKSLSNGVNANTSTFTLTSYSSTMLYLNLTNAQSSYGFDNQVNGNTDTFVAYCWYEVPGFSKFGSYTGNGSNSGGVPYDGPYVHLGFRPAWVMIKELDDANNWIIMDNKRGAVNDDLGWLYADLSYYEESGSGRKCDFLSTGFKIRSPGTGLNSSNDTYIYMAFAEQPVITPFDTFSNAR